MLRHWGAVLAMVLAGFSASAQAQDRAGTVLLAVGEATAATPNAEPRPLRKGDAVYSGETLRTRPYSYLNVRFVDGAKLIMRPDSEFEIGSYQVAPALEEEARKEAPAQPRLPPAMATPPGNVLLRLLKGSFRIVSGLVGKASPDDYRVVTPIATIGIRGTDFGVDVAADTTSSVYVFDGAVQVANAQIPGQSVLLHPGEKTIVRPLQPPSSVMPFDPGEADHAGAPKVLDRAEDPLLETSEAPVFDRYLAVPDPDIDAQVNPAYAAESRGLRSTLAMTGYYGNASEHLAAGGQQTTPEQFQSHGLLAQDVTLLQAAQQSWLGFTAGGGRLADDATVLTRAPGDSTSVFTQQKTSTGRADFGALGAQQLGRWTVGAGARSNRSRIDLSEQPVSGGAETLTTSDNRVTSYQLGGLLDARSAQTLGVVATYQDLDSATRSGALDKALTGRVQAFEVQQRWGMGDAALAGARVRFDHSVTSEDISDASGPFYNETFRVSSVKAGFGVAVPWSGRGVFTGDIAVGYSREDALQRFPDGRVREDEDDTRISASLHLGTQIHITPHLLATLNTVQQYVDDDKRFLIEPGTANQRSDRTRSRRNDTLVESGLGLTWGRYFAGYFASATTGSSRPVTHNLYLIMEWGR